MTAARKPAEPERRCIVSGARASKDDMLRFVIGPDGAVVPDVAEKLPGRGLWLMAERDIILAACAKGAFARAARTEVRVPGDLVEETARQLRRRCLELFGLARRAGQAACGDAKVRAQLAKGRAGVLLEAADGAAEGRAKIRALAPAAPVVALFGAAELGAQAGRDRLVHAAIERGRLASRLVVQAGKLARIAAPGAADRAA